jgi:hypothetical protein
VYWPGVPWRVTHCLTSLLGQDLSSAHLVSLQSRLMTSSHTTAQYCRKIYAAALPLVGSLCRNLWMSSVGECLNWCLFCSWNIFSFTLNTMYVQMILSPSTRGCAVLQFLCLYHIQILSCYLGVGCCVHFRTQQLFEPWHCIRHFMSALRFYQLLYVCVKYWRHLKTTCCKD